MPQCSLIGELSDESTRPDDTVDSRLLFKYKFLTMGHSWEKTERDIGIRGSRSGHLDPLDQENDIC